MSEEKKNPEFAFVVLKQADGRYAIANLDDAELQRQPTLDDVYTAIKVVERDMVIQNTAVAVVNTISQAAGPPPADSGLVVPKPAQKFQKVTRV